jgi:hypothetical protein
MNSAAVRPAVAGNNSARRYDLKGGSSRLPAPEPLQPPPEPVRAARRDLGAQWS